MIYNIEVDETFITQFASQIETRKFVFLPIWTRVIKLIFTHILHELRLTVTVDFFFMLQRSSKIFPADNGYFVSLVQASVKIIRCTEHRLRCLWAKCSSSWTDESVFACCFRSWNSCVTHLKFENKIRKLQLLLCINTWHCTINEDNLNRHGRSNC